MTVIKNRAFGISLLVFSLFILPWWVTVLVAVLFMAVYNSPYEVLPVGLALDYLYRVQSGDFIMDHALFIFIAVLFIISFLVKDHLSFGA
jgi:hypothetical protein